MRAGSGASAVNQVESVTGLHVWAMSTGRHLGGAGTCVPGMRLFLRVLTGERWGENEGPGTVRELDRLTVLLPVA